VTVNQTPQTPSITSSGPTNFCDGGSVTLSAPAGLAYLWSNGSTNQSITIGSTGSYSVQTISGSCTSAVSQATEVTVNQTPQTPSITAGGPTSFCDGGSVTLSAPAGFTYLWSNGSTNQSISVNSTGSYTVQTISGNCTSAISQQVTVLASIQPDQLNISSAPDANSDSIRLSGSGATSYKWFEESLSNPLPLGNQSSLLVPCWSSPGKWYFLKGWNNGNESCYSLDSQLVVCTPAMADKQNGIRLLVLPNPSRGLFELSVENLRGSARLEVLDALGKLVYEGELESEGMFTRQLLDIRHVAMGVYTLRLQTSQGPKHLRLKKD
jgi:hypothetical protein